MVHSKQVDAKKTKHMLVLRNYADFLFESTVKRELEMLDKVQARAIRPIRYGDASSVSMERVYSIIPLRERRRKHHLSLMYRLSKIETYIDTDRPEIVLRSRDKIKFQTPVTKLTKVMKSPYYRGVSLWDMLNEEQQKATTKVRFKQGLE